VDRHRFVADPSPIFHIDAHPDPDLKPYTTPTFKHVEKSKNKFDLFSQQCFIIVICIIGVTIFNISYLRFLKFSVTNYSS
jgi:hypothetical protein